MPSRMPNQLLNQVLRGSESGSDDDGNSHPVVALGDYLRSLEDRIEELESRGAPKPEEKPKAKSTKLVDMSVRFFDKTEQSKIRPAIWNSHIETKGAYCSDDDEQQFIRVLYDKLWIDIPVLPSVPSPEDIDVVEFGVLSSPITEFFGHHMNMPSQELGIDDGKGRLLRFHKPFKHLIRLWDQVKNNLKILEKLFGALENSGQGQTPVSSSRPLGEGLDKEEESNNPPPSPVPPPLWLTDEALPHFRIFVQFVDTYFGDYLCLYKDLRERNRKTVSNHTLIPRYTPQVYRVTSVMGGTRGVGIMYSEGKARHMKKPTTMPQKASDQLPDDPGDSKQPRQQGDKAGPLDPEVISPSRPLSKARGVLRDLIIFCYYLDFNGQEYGCVQDILIFKPFEREINITDLEAYPLTTEKKAELQIRGQRFVDSTRLSHMHYQGFTIGPNRAEIDSPVIVDMKMAFTEDSNAWERTGTDVPRFLSFADSRFLFWRTPNNTDGVSNILGAAACGRPWCGFHPPIRSVTFEDAGRRREAAEGEIRALLDDRDRTRTEKALSPNLLHLLPGSVPGFALRNRKWALLDLTILLDVKRTYSWDNLVLPPGHRRMVQAMVETHATENRHRHLIGMDSVPGKGKGCIILLHGVPGVGKTSTADCVAAHTKKPLYPITCGDVGSTPQEVEWNMEHHFKLAHKWGCVLLLDEADVFLAKRGTQKDDVERNGIVSIFLRILEYYSGILFLTTNRVGSMDDAFRSRLHLSLFYPKLDKDQTIQIFKRNFERVGEINKDRQEHNLPPFKYKTQEEMIIGWVDQNWKKLRWNGRQIRNAFQTVMALAEFKAKPKPSSGTDDQSRCRSPTLTKQQFEIVAKASKQFAKYLKATLGQSDERIAKRDKIRVDVAPEVATSEDDSSEESDSDEDDSDKEDSDDNIKRKGKKTAAKNSKSGKKGKESKEKKKADKKVGSGKKKKVKKSESEDDEDDEDDEDTEDEE
ncbi:aaa family atpase protein [Cercophora samala]|uniref:Aaa family atpase protein n=1 Tax=Cercophora samala TaxID=330535 RepID=A0AA39ZIY9_9PEZI|nr:aaa family atpase protein [Cercophora samala]